MINSCYTKITDHDTVCFANRPEVDFLVVAPCDKNMSGLVPQRQAVNIGVVSSKLLWNSTDGLQKLYNHK